MCTAKVEASVFSAMKSCAKPKIPMHPVVFLLISAIDIYGVDDATVCPVPRRPT